MQYLKQIFFLILKLINLKYAHDIMIQIIRNILV